MKVVDRFGKSHWGQRSLLKLTEIAQSSMGAGNYDHALLRTGETRLIAAVSSLFGPLTALDVGAHHGAWTSVLLKNSAHNKVIALEPDPQSFALLSAAVRDDSRAFLMNAAVGDHDGDQILFVDPGNSQLSTLLPSVLNRIPEYSTEEPPDQISVRTLRLETVLNEAVTNRFITSPSDVNLVKIDTEGFELAILKQSLAALAAQHLVVQFEFNSHALACGQFVDTFEEQIGESFQLFRLAPRRLIRKQDLSFSAANFAGFSNWAAIPSEIADRACYLYRSFAS